MKRTTLFKVAAAIVSLAVVLVLAMACSGVSQNDYNALQSKLTAKEKEAADLQQQLQTAQAQAKNTILFIKPNAPPRATPTPLPPGVTPSPAPAAPTVPPAPAAAIGFYVDTVTAGPGESPFNVDPSLSCVRNSAFKRGMHVVWRMQLVDSATGKVVQRDDVERVELKLPNGETRNFNFGRHGATDTAPWFWTTAWNVPLDYPLGSVDYSIEVVTKSGSTGTFKEIPVSAPQAGIESRLQVID